MYGSSFHFEQSMNSKRISTMELHNQISKPKSEKKKFFMIVGLITLALTMTATSQAAINTLTTSTLYTKCCEK